VCYKERRSLKTAVLLTERESDLNLERVCVFDRVRERESVCVCVKIET